MKRHLKILARKVVKYYIAGSCIELKVFSRCWLLPVKGLWPNSGLFLRQEGKILVLAASGDSITGGGPEQIKKAAVGAQMKGYDGTAHGTGLFRTNPDSLEIIATFFNGAL